MPLARTRCGGAGALRCRHQLTPVLAHDARSGHIRVCLATGWSTRRMSSTRSSRTTPDVWSGWP